MERLSCQESAFVKSNLNNDHMLSEISEMSGENTPDLALRVKSLELELQSQKYVIHKVENMKVLFLDMISICEDFETRLTLLEQQFKDRQEITRSIDRQRTDILKTISAHANDTKQMLEASNVRISRLEKYNKSILCRIEKFGKVTSHSLRIRKTSCLRIFMLIVTPFIQHFFN